MRTLLTHILCLVCYTQALNLGGNTIGNTGISSLADALGNGALSSLTALCLFQNQIGDAGLSALSEAVGKGATPRPAAGHAARAHSLKLVGLSVCVCVLASLEEAIGLCS